MAQPSIPVEVVGLQYVTVAAGSTDTLLKNLGGQKGDFLFGVLVIPATTSPGAVSIKDGPTTATPITLFTGGATSVADLRTFFIPIGANSVVADGWKITTGSNVAAIAVGRFS